MARTTESGLRLLFVAAVVAAMAACGPPTDDSGDRAAAPASPGSEPRTVQPRPTLRPELARALSLSRQTVVVCLPGAEGDEYMEPLAASLIRTALPYGLDLRFHYGHGDAEEQEALLREMAGLEARALLLWALPSPGVIEAASELTTAGYPVITLVQPLPTAGIGVHVGSDPETLNRQIAARLAAEGIARAVVLDCTGDGNHDGLRQAMDQAGVATYAAGCDGSPPAGMDRGAGRWALLAPPAGDSAMAQLAGQLGVSMEDILIYRLLPTAAFLQGKSALDTRDVLPNLDETGRRALQVLLDRLAGKDTPALVRVDELQPPRY